MNRSSSGARHRVPHGRTVESNAVAKATDTDYVDVCIDESGLMLEEMAVNSGKVSLRILATEIEFEPTFAADIFTINLPPLGTADGAPVLDEIDKATIPNANLLHLATLPDGFEHKVGSVEGAPQPKRPPKASPTKTATSTSTQREDDRVHQGLTENERKRTGPKNRRSTRLLGRKQALPRCSETRLSRSPGMCSLHINATLRTEDIQRWPPLRKATCSFTREVAPHLLANERVADNDRTR